jgi:hypothetical protein
MRSQQVGWKNYLFWWIFKVSLGMGLLSKKGEFDVIIAKKTVAD